MKDYKDAREQDVTPDLAALDAFARKPSIAPPLSEDRLAVLDAQEAIERLADLLGGYQRLAVIVRNLAHVHGEDIPRDLPIQTRNPFVTNDGYPAVTYAVRVAMLSSCGPALASFLGTVPYEDARMIARELARTAVKAYEKGGR